MFDFEFKNKLKSNLETYWKDQGKKHEALRQNLKRKVQGIRIGTGIIQLESILKGSEINQTQFVDVTGMDIQSRMEKNML